MTRLEPPVLFSSRKEVHATIILFSVTKTLELSPSGPSRPPTDAAGQYADSWGEKKTKCQVLLCQVWDNLIWLPLQGVAGPDKDGGATGHPTSIPSPGTGPQTISCF